MLGLWLAQPPGSQPESGRYPLTTTSSSTSTAVAVAEPAFSPQERLALAGYTGLTREAYALDLRQYASWCRLRHLRLTGGQTPVKVQPRTGLLREGLDQVPTQRYFVHEEEEPRAGTRLMVTCQRTRWSDGRVFVWQRVRRQTGRGEGASGLAFDQLADTPSSSQ